jgi:hypothetical protein
MPLNDDGDFEHAARKLRTEVGIDDRFCPDMIFVLNELTRLGKIKGFVCVPDEKMTDDASYDSDERLLNVRESVFRVLDHPLLGPKQDRRRARFSIAHELGHMVSGHDGKYFRGPTSGKAIMLGSRIRPRENEANKFAAAFLAPSHLAKPIMTVEQISELFDISMYAAELRREALAKMDRRARKIDRPLPKGVADWLREQREKGYNTPSLDREDARKNPNTKRKQKDDEGDPEK